MFDISISIVSYNTKDLLENCLNSIYRYAGELDFEVILVDNASVDGSPDMVVKRFPSAKLLENKVNIGFGKAHNQAFTLSSGKYFLILNSDTELHPGTLKNMLDFMEDRQDVGIAGCKTFLDSGHVFVFPKHAVPSILNSLILYTNLCGIFPGCPICRKFWNQNYKLWSVRIPVMVNGIDGGAMLFRRKTFENLGGFDRNIFMFFYRRFP